jgi:hypothetical protein
MPASSNRLVISSGPGITRQKNPAALRADGIVRPIRILPAQTGFLYLPGGIVKFLRDLQTLPRRHPADQILLELLRCANMGKLPPLVSRRAFHGTGANLWMWFRQFLFPRPVGTDADAFQLIAS